MIRKIAGNHQPVPGKHLSISNSTIMDKKVLTNILAETFSKKILQNVIVNNNPKL